MAEKNGQRIAIEVETGKSDAIYNIRKDLVIGLMRFGLSHSMKKLETK